MYELTHLDNEALYEGLNKIAARGRLVGAVQLAYVAEVDRRHLYLREGFESMKACCMRKFDLTEDAAKKWIQAARIGLEFPQVFPAIADGRLTATSVRVLGPHLNRENVDHWIEKAAHRTVQEVERLLANCFPLAEPMLLDDGIYPQVVQTQQQDSNSGALRHPSPLPVPRTKVAPTAGERFHLSGSMPGDMHDRLRYAQQLLGHAVPSGNVFEILDRGLKALIPALERKKFGVGSKRSKANIRGIPARVKYAVFKRDGGKCVILLEDGTRCNSEDRIEYDHIIPRAKGGPSTADNLRLVCHAHNQWAAEQEFGRDFMTRKRNPRKNK